MIDQYSSVHLKHPIPDLSKPFEITCAAGTDVWEKPPSVHSFNAPIIFRTTTVEAFKSARVTVSASWTHKYDQGGLCLVINGSDGRRWVKTGIEYLNDQANASTVATDRWSDWSLNPLQQGSGATLQMDSAEDGSLWVYLVREDGKKQPLREVTWWNDLKPDTECWIGPYAAKPAPHGEKEDLVVQYDNLVIELK